MTKPPEDLLSRLAAARSILVTSHVNPDGDALGSSLALAAAARDSGRAALVWHRDKAPTVLAAFEAAEPPVHRGIAAPDGFPQAFDLVVALECPTLDRSGLAEALAALPLANIDHHLGNAMYGDHNWVAADEPAVASMVFQALRALGWPVTPATAQALFLGLHSDTGGFRFGNASESAFATAAALVGHGARPDRVATLLYERQPLASVRLLGSMLGTLHLDAGGRVASVALTREMFRQAGAGPEDAEGLIDVPRSIAGVEAVVLLREEPGGAIKGSLRSRGEVDVERVARALGGGGHRNAAGFRSEATLAALRQRVVAALEAALEPDPARN